jgi:hypothetical protein
MEFKWIIRDGDEHKPSAWEEEARAIRVRDGEIKKERQRVEAHCLVNIPLISPYPLSAGR